MNRIGKKTRKNIANNAELKKRFVEMNITTCELGYDGCMRNTMLSFAHAKRRRKFDCESDWMDVILACTLCHHRLDYDNSHEDTERIVHDVINRR